MNSKSNEGILCLHGAIIMFAAFVAGGMIGAAALGQVEGSVEGWKLAHMEPLINSILLFAIAGVLGKLALSLVDAATIVVATPTVLAGPHPLAAYAVFLANALKPKAKYLSVIGSYGWGGKAVQTLAGMIPNLKVEVIDPYRSAAANLPRTWTRRRNEILTATAAVESAGAAAEAAAALKQSFVALAENRYTLSDFRALMADVDEILTLLERVRGLDPGG